MATCILAGCLLNPPTAEASCQNYKAVVVPFGPCVKIVAFEWTGELSHVTVDFLDPQMIFWATVLLWGGTIWYRPTRFCKKYILEPIIPPPRFP